MTEEEINTYLKEFGEGLHRDNQLIQTPREYINEAMIVDTPTDHLLNTYFILDSIPIKTNKDKEIIKLMLEEMEIRYLASLRA